MSLALPYFTVRKILFLLFIINLVFLNSPNCQSTFLKRYEIAGFENNAYFTTILATDSCYWVYGAIWDTSKPYFGGTAIFKFDVRGNLIKQKELISKTDFYGFNNDMFAIHNKLYTSILNPYSTSSIIAYDIIGDSFQIVATVGNLLPEGNFLSINNLHFDLLGNFYLANSVSSKSTTDSYTQVQLVKFNNNFEIEWSKQLGNINIDEIPYSIATDSTGNVYVGGQRLKLNYVEGDGNYSRSIVYKLSTDGELLKETTADRLSGAVFDFAIDVSGNYICASEVLLPYHPQRPFSYPAYQKLEHDGKVIFRQYFEEAPKEEKFYSNFSKIMKIENSYYVLGGIGVFDNDVQPLIAESRAIFIKCDEYGNLIWKRIYKTAYGIEATNLYDFDATKDGGFIMAGLGAVGGNDSIGWKSMLLKVDSVGCLIPGCQIVNNDDIKLSSDDEFLLYPNPIEDYLVLLHQDKEKVIYNISSLDGKQIQKFTSSIQGEQIIISTNSYLPGAYIISANFQNGKSISRTFIKQ